jgi:oligo-1,6-glucosidase/alpha-glucosidase
MDARFFASVLRHYETFYPSPYTPVYVFGNHDQKRVISKIDDDVRMAKLLALFQFTVRGVPVTYYGEEIGMAEGRFPASTAKDPVGRQYGWVPGFLLDLFGLYVNRDGCRTPMQWDDSGHAGFCEKGATPWLPVHQNYGATNVKTGLADEDSLLNVYKGLLRLRRESAAIQEGEIQLIDNPDVGANLLAYRRDCDDEAVLVLINFGGSPGTFQNRTACQQIRLAVGLDAPANPDKITLPPYSGLVLGN